MGSANLNDRSQRGDGDSEIALVVEDTDLIQTTMNGQPYMANRFAATLRRQLFKEHLGLIKPQNGEKDEEITSFMRAAPHPNDDETESEQDQLVADPLADSTLNLWQNTARVNREVFTEIFRPVPTNLVRNWDTYSVSKFVSGHEYIFTLRFRTMSQRSKAGTSSLVSTFVLSRTACLVSAAHW
jgi:phospholipase D1/2